MQLKSSLTNIVEGLLKIQILQPVENEVCLYYDQLHVDKKIMITQEQELELLVLGWSIDKEFNVFRYDF